MRHAPYPADIAHLKTQQQGFVSISKEHNFFIDFFLIIHDKALLAFKISTRKEKSQTVSFWCYNQVVK